MRPTRKYAFCLAVVAMLAGFPGKLFSQWYGEAEYRFGLNKRSLSTLEIGQTEVMGAIANPYTLGGYSFSTGYAFRPDSLNLAFSTGISYLKSNSGTMLYNQRPYDPAYSALKHEIITVDLGLSLEFKIKKNVNSSTGFSLLLPVYMKGVELQQTKTTSDLIEERREVHYRRGPGIRVHQDFTIWTNGQATFFAGISAGWISALRKSRTLMNGNLSVPASKREMQYLTDRQISEKGKINDPSLSGFDPDLPMETTTYNEPLSFVALKMGVSYYLHKRR